MDEAVEGGKKRRGGGRKGGGRRGERKEEDPLPGRCALFVQKRGRYCRLAVARGSKYCGEHLTFDPAQTDAESALQRRIPCPLDPHHTVYEHLLEKHLKKCNSANKNKMACYHSNINTGIHGYEPSDEEKRPLSTFPMSRLDELIKRVKMICEEVEQSCPLETVVLEHPVLASDLCNHGNGGPALKHIQQQASILGHLDQLHLLTPHNCYIEFGAGRGKLSNCIQRVFQPDEVTYYLLIDRGSCRRKFDVYRHGDGRTVARIKRLLIDIEHLDLGKEDFLKEEGIGDIVAVSKHLCGAATDLTLKCLINTFSRSHDQPLASHDQQEITSSTVTLPKDKSPSPPQAKRICTSSTPPSSTPHPSHHHKLSAVVIALCCHHRCRWDQMVETEWLSGCGFTPVDFHLITKMSSWAVCGVKGEGDGALEHKDDDGDDDTMATVTTATSPTPLPRSYHPHPREAHGLLCKRLLDLARVRYLRGRGWETKLVYFVSRATSLENVLLVATPPT